MAVVVASNSTPRQKDPAFTLRHELNTFDTALTDDQRKHFRLLTSQPDPSSVLMFVADIDKRNAGKRLRCVAPRICTFLDAVQQFTGVVDVFVSSNPKIAALIWGGIRFAIVTASNVASYFDKVTTMLMKVGKQCPTYQQFGHLYRDCVPLQQSLCEFFAVVVRLSTRIIEVTRRPSVIQLVSAIFNPFEQDFRDVLQDLDQVSKDFLLQVSLASKTAIQETQRLLKLEHSEGKQYRFLSRSFQQDTQNEHTEARRWRLRQIERDIHAEREAVRKNLSTIDHERLWKQALRPRVLGTAEWFRQQSAFQNWCKDETTAVLWLSGTMGTGKTVLMSNIVAHLQTSRTQSDVVAYYFCRSDQVESLQARAVLGGLALQLLAGDIQRAKDDLLAGLLKDTQNLDVYALARFLISRMDVNTTYTVTMDGLDECPQKELRILRKCLREMCSTRPKGLRILCSGRPELEHELCDELPLKYRMSVNRDRDHDDIAKYITFKLQECLEDERLKLMDPELGCKIRDSIQDRAKGMFLWPHLVIEELCHMKSDEDILKELNRLPRGLTGLLDRKLESMEKERGTGYSIKMLQYCGVARRPLDLGELQEALSVAPGQKLLDRNRMPNDMNHLVLKCRGMLFVDEEDETVQFPHGSIREHVLVREGRRDQVPFEHGLDIEFGTVCMTYLTFADFQRQLTKVSSKKVVEMDPIQLGLAATGRSHKRVSEMAIRLLQLRRPSQKIDLNHVANNASKSAAAGGEDGASSPEGQQHFRFHGYAGHHWYEHVKSLTPDHTHSSQALFQRLVEDLSISADRPWDVLEEGEHSDLSKSLTWAMKNEHCALFKLAILRGSEPRVESQLQRGLQHWKEDSESVNLGLFVPLSDALEIIAGRELLEAAKSGKELLVSLLLNAGTNIHFRDEQDEDALTIASRRNRPKVIQALLGAGADVNVHGGRYGSALQAAAERGHRDCLELLLDRGADIDAQGGEHDTALLLAARSGHRDCLELLLDRGADVNAQGGYYGSALQAAAQYSFYDCLELLLDRGADVNAQGGRYGIALQAAAERGHRDCLELLLDRGADVNAQGGGYGTALQAAAERGHRDCLELLLERGADVNAQGGYYGSALQAAAERGYCGGLELLLDRGADVNLRGNSSTCALHLAILHKERTAEKILRKAGAKCDGCGPS